MLVARSLSCSIRDVQCTSQAHMLLARTDRDVCVRLFVPSRPRTDARLKITAHCVLPEKTSITMSIEKLNGGTTESHGETRRQRLHLQHRSGKLHNSIRVGAHGSPHHLRNGGDIGLLEGIPENRRGSVDRTPTRNAHLRSTVCSQARNAHTARLAQELQCDLCALGKNLGIWCVPCPILGRLTCLSPRALHLLSFFLV